jgi:HSP20 family molecular chaperone IbpA
MFNDPEDMFQEMDAVFDRIFKTMSRDFDYPESLLTGYRVTFASDGLQNESLGLQMDAEFQGSENIEPEVQRFDDKVVVIAEMPGITDSNLNLSVRGQQLIIDASGEERVNHTIATLPVDVDKASMKYTLKNGVLEVTFTIKPEES